MVQANYAGIPNDALIENGPYSTNRGIPLGLRHTDGKRSYRWAHVAESVYNLGQCFVKPRSGTYGTKMLGSAYVRSTAYNAGQGGANAVGSVDIYLYSAVFLSCEKYEGGDMMVLSGGGMGHSYPIDSYEIGAAGKRTHLKIRRGLGAALGTGAKILFKENDYYGVKKPSKDVIDFPTKMDAIELGAATASDGDISNTSGYQWLQTGGPGIGLTSSVGVVGAPGDPLGITAQGTLSSPLVLDAASGAIRPSAALKVVARALNSATVARRFVAVDWLIETPL